MRRLSFAAMAAAVGAIVVLQLAGTVAPNATTLGLLLVLVLLVTSLIAPRHVERFVYRLSRFKFGGLEVGFDQTERASVAQRLLEPDRDGVAVDPMTRTGSTLTDLLVVKNRFDKRLRWLGTEFGLGTQESGAILLELRAKALITDEEFLFARDLLAPDNSDLPALPAAAQERYIERAWSFVSRVRPGVFDRAVRQLLDRHGWFICDYRQPAGDRADFLARRGTEWWLIAARIAADNPNDEASHVDEVQRVRDRWTAGTPVPFPVEQEVIVVPGASQCADELGRPRIVKRTTLADELAA